MLRLTLLSLGVAWVGLARRQSEFFLVVSLLFPWIFLLLCLLTLPLLGAAFQRFTLSESTRRNHAIEHGTIQNLNRGPGRRKKISGQAEERGFRIAGIEDTERIRTSFREFARQIGDGDWSAAVARGCGSNIVTAEALGVTLLAVALLLMFLIPFPAWATIGILATILLTVLVVRYPVGMWIQKKRFLLLDFAHIRIESISEVPRARLTERHPVFFVKTQVSRRVSTLP